MPFFCIKIVHRPQTEIKGAFLTYPLSNIKRKENMTRQIQIRRGTTAEHENFIGAIGEITMDTDTKTLRVHDGETPSGIALARADQKSDSTLPANCDFVIESGQNGNSWYRKYQSGWVEQGGIVNTGGVVTITFPIEMLDTNYTFIGTPKSNTTTNTGWVMQEHTAISRTTTGVTIATKFVNEAISGNGIGGNWLIFGWSATN